MTIIQANPLRTYGISGPTSATDNEISSFDGTTGKKIQAGSGVINPSANRLDLSEVRAKDANGLKLYEDGGAGIFVEDGGNVGINEAAPDCGLHITNKAILAEGMAGGTPISGAGARMMWVGAKAAFRVGYVTGTQWDDANINYMSFAGGYNNIARGVYSAAFAGYNNQATNMGSVILTGTSQINSGAYSGIVAGSNNNIGGGYSGIVAGSNNNISGGYSGIVSGHNLQIASTYSVASGVEMQLTAAADNTFVHGHHSAAVSIPTPNAFLVFPSGTLGNMGLGTYTFGTAANAVFGIGNGVAPTSSPADMVQLYAQDAAGSSELMVRDEAGNVTTLSPHTFKLFEKPDPMAWDFYSKNPYTGKEINVDMWSAIRDLEALTKKKYIYEAVLAPEDVENKAEQLEEDVIFATMQEKIEIPLAEAIEQIPIMEFVQEGTETVYELDKKTGKLIATERPKMVEQPTGEMKYKFKKGCEAVAGKCYRRKNRTEATSGVGA